MWQAVVMKHYKLKAKLKSSDPRWWRVHDWLKNEANRLKRIEMKAQARLAPELQVEDQAAVENDGQSLGGLGLLEPDGGVGRQ